MLCHAPPSHEARAVAFAHALSFSVDASPAAPQTDGVLQLFKPKVPEEEPKMKAVPRCYLIFETSNAGSFYLQWNETAELLDGALAVFEPTIPVARHKLTSGGGRSELCRDVSGPGKAKRFFQGWTYFIKQAKSFKGTFTFLGNVPAKPVAIYFNDVQTNVIKVGTLHFSIPTLIFHCLAGLRYQGLILDDRSAVAPDHRP